jgi:DNA topoisomerase-1
VLIVAKPGKYGPYVKRGDDTASVPDDLAPDELTVAKALELLALPKSDEPIGELDGFPVFAKSGRYGPYVQWGAPDNLPPGLEKPKMASLLSTMTLEHVTVDDAEQLLSLPRVVGDDPADGEPITAQNGRYGPYISKGKESRSLASEEQIFSVTLDQALALLAQPRQYRGRGPAKPPLRDFGSDPVSGRAVVAKEGRFGVYVTDGETNASLSKGDRLEAMLPERAYELLAARRETVAASGGPAKRSSARKAPAKKAPAKKAAAKKAPAKKAAAKSKAPAKKSPTDR